jgi:hypothetical protein
MSEFTDDTSAFYYGYSDATNYEAFNTNVYDFSDEGIENYRTAYAKGMSANLCRENGEAPLENRSEDYQETYSYYLTRHANHR